MPNDQGRDYGQERDRNPREISKLLKKVDPMKCTDIPLMDYNGQFTDSVRPGAAQGWRSWRKPPTQVATLVVVKVSVVAETLAHRSIAGLGTSEVGIRMWRAITT